MHITKKSSNIGTAYCRRINVKTVVLKNTVDEKTEEPKIEEPKDDSKIETHKKRAQRNKEANPDENE